MSLQQINQLIVFARAPEYGRVKQRLARDIGPDEALRFYRETLTALLRKMNNGAWRLSVSVANPGDEDHPVFRGVDTTPQITGDLGQRMKAALNQYAGTRRIIIGSDIPSIERAHITDAFNRLSDNDLVFGPAPDGGFWLVGCNEYYPANADDNEFMRNVRWSTGHALADTIASLPAARRQRVARVSTLSDVDDGNSFRQFNAGELKLKQS